MTDAGGVGEELLSWGGRCFLPQRENREIMANEKIEARAGALKLAVRSNTCGSKNNMVL